MLKFTPLHFLLDPRYIRWAKVTMLLIFAVVLHLTPFGTVPMYISTLHLWRLTPPPYPLLCGCEWQSIKESFLTVKFIRQESRVLWGKCWNKTPSEEGLELKGIKHYRGGYSVKLQSCSDRNWVGTYNYFFIPQNRAGNGKSLPKSSVGSSAIMLYDFFSLINCMLYLQITQDSLQPPQGGGCLSD